MPRKFFRKYLPSHESVRDSRYLAWCRPWLGHPNLWHLNRHSVSGGMALGLFAGLVPGSNPAQFAAAALLAIAFRVNLPVAVVVTLYTNPFTIVPLYLLAYQYGKLLVGGDGTFTPGPEFDWAHIGQWLDALLAWMISLGKPLAVGLVALALTLAALGYAVVQIGWRIHVTLAWRHRCQKRMNAL